MIPESKWKWFGSAGHFICGHHCRFHLCTLIGNVLVSTVGQYLPPHKDKDGAKYEKIGCARTFETMAFKVSRSKCTAKDCMCGMPEIIPDNIEFAGYNTAGEATIGHMKICRKIAKEDAGTKKCSR